MDYTQRAGPVPKAIPAEIRELHQWVVFDLVERVTEQTGEIRLDKVPYNPRHTQHRASTTDPTTWGSFDQALAVYRANPKMDGIGFVFTAGDPYTGLDFDKCIKDGKLDSEVAEWLKKLGGYAEVSPSGTGVHAIVRAKLPGPGKHNKALGIEVYDKDRFFTITGWTVGEYSTPTAAQEAVDELYRLVRPTPKAERQLRRLLAPALVNDEVLSKARIAANGWKFKALYDEGDWQKLKYPSQSEADYALASKLVFWTGGDQEQIVELFEQSALYRTEKRGGYVRRTVSAALDNYTGSYYDPKHKSTGVREDLEPYFQLLDLPIWRKGKWPSARKVFAANLLIASEHGSRTKKGIRFGIDMRTLGQVAHVSTRTLLYNSLPLLVRERLVKWVSKGKGRQSSSVFLLPLPPSDEGVWGYNTRRSHAYSVLPTHTLGNEERRELLRASVGRSPYAASLVWATRSRCCLRTW